MSEHPAFRQMDHQLRMTLRERGLRRLPYMPPKTLEHADQEVERVKRRVQNQAAYVDLERRLQATGFHPHPKRSAEARVALAVERQRLRRAQLTAERIRHKARRSRPAPHRPMAVRVVARAPRRSVRRAVRRPAPRAADPPPPASSPPAPSSPPSTPRAP